jgi:hypothetical protein
MPLACSAAPEASEVATERAESAIINGTTVSTKSFSPVAIYHQVRDAGQTTYYWHPRPCSGRLLNPHAPYKAILTARHCVAQLSGLPYNGATINADQIRVTGETAPGPNLPSDPSRTATPYWVSPFPKTPNGYLGPYDPLDLAIIWVYGSIPGLTTSPESVGLYLGPTPDLLGTSTTHYGYCWRVDGDDSTAGTLRAAYGEPIIIANKEEAYDYTPGNAYPTHGDSGGPGPTRSSRRRTKRSRVASIWRGTIRRRTSRSVSGGATAPTRRSG